MISVLIAAYKEPITIANQIDAFLKQKYPGRYEILLCASDQETFKVMKKYEKKHKQVKAYKDKRLGKPHALNLLFKKANGKILILSDGDVLIHNNAVEEIIKPFKNPKVGAVAGRPISINKKTTKLGYWSHLLTDVGAHKTRIREVKKGNFIVCSGYLFAMRNILKQIPNDALADDAYMSQAIWEMGYKISYTPKSKVYVKYPATFDDWILQKRRSGGGNHQLKYYFKNPQTMRTFWSEAFWGTLTAFSYPQTFKELWWTFCLFPARIKLWKEIKRHINKELNLLELWKPVETTK